MATTSTTKSDPVAPVSQNLNLDEELDALLKAYIPAAELTRSIDDATQYFSPNSVLDNKQYPADAKDNLCRLLNAYCYLCPEIPRFLLLLNLWLRSHDVTVDGFNYTCLCLMVIAFLIKDNHVVNLQHPDASRLVVENGSTLNPQDTTAAEQPVWYDLEAHLSKPQQDPISMVQMAKEFWRFWARNFDNNGQIVSLENGGFIPRHPQKDPAGDADGETASPADKNKDGRQRQQDRPSFIVRDPFVGSHNHASRVSRKQWGIFVQLSSRCYRIVEEKGSLSDLFGPTLKPLSAQIEMDDSVGAAIDNLYLQHRPPQSVLDARSAVIQRVIQAIQSRFSRDYTVECFGSTGYGVDTSTSDLDLVIIDSLRLNGFAPDVVLAGLPEIYNMKRVANVLQNARFSNIFAVPHATVPIVKFYDSKSSLQMDINCNDQLGLFNTRLMDAYCDIFPPLRAMIFFIKKWANVRNLNDPAGQKGPTSFSSYCYALMIIAFLQMKGVLPNLQSEDAVKPLSNEEFWIRTKDDRRIRCDVRVGNAEGFESKGLSLGDGVYQWFRYFAYEYPYGKEFLSIRYGGLLPAHLKPKKGEKQKGRKQKKDGKQPAEEAKPEVIPVGPSSEKAKEEVEVEVEALEEANEQLEEAAAAAAATAATAAPPPPPPPQEDDLSGLKTSWLAVQDPFILAKNVPVNVAKDMCQRFQRECQKTVSLLEAGTSIEDLLREDQTRAIFTRGGRGGGKNRNQGRGQARGGGPKQSQPSGPPPAAAAAAQEAPGPSRVESQRPENPKPAQEKTPQRSKRGENSKPTKEKAPQPTRPSLASRITTPPPPEYPPSEYIAQGQARLPQKPATSGPSKPNRARKRSPRPQQQASEDQASKEASSPPNQQSSQHRWQKGKAKGKLPANNVVQEPQPEPVAPQQQQQQQQPPREKRKDRLTVTTSSAPPTPSEPAPNTPEPSSSTSPTQGRRNILQDRAISQVLRGLGYGDSARSPREFDQAF